MCVTQFYAWECLITWLDKICIEWNLRIYRSVCVLNLKFSNRLVLTTQVYCSKMMNNPESITSAPRIPSFYFCFTFVVYNLCLKKNKSGIFFSHWFTNCGLFSLKFLSGKGSIYGNYKNPLLKMMKSTGSYK